MVLVCDNCGSIRPSEKAKIEKGAKPRFPAMKKKELAVSIRQDSGAIQQKSPTMPTRLTANADKSSISSQYLL